MIDYDNISVSLKQLKEFEDSEVWQLFINDGGNTLKDCYKSSSRPKIL